MLIIKQKYHTLDFAAEYRESHHPPPSFLFDSEFVVASLILSFLQISSTSLGCLQTIYYALLFIKLINNKLSI